MTTNKQQLNGPHCQIMSIWVKVTKYCASKYGELTTTVISSIFRWIFVDFVVKLIHEIKCSLKCNFLLTFLIDRVIGLDLPTDNPGNCYFVESTKTDTLEC